VIKLVFAIALFLITPALGARQNRPTDTQPQANAPSDPQTALQPAAQNPNAQTQVPADIRPGHPLDPADVDVLTGKRDRQLAAAQRANAPVLASPYGELGYYGDHFWMNGRLGETWDIPMLPLPRISNPFFLGSGARRGWGGRGFGGRR
jgi:hypothetical protein